MWVTPGDATDTPGTAVWANEMWGAEWNLLGEVYRIFGVWVFFFFCFAWQSKLINISSSIIHFILLLGH